jgi:hypothetical protein
MEQLCLGKGTCFMSRKESFIENKLNYHEFERKFSVRIVNYFKTKVIIQVKIGGRVTCSSTLGKKLSNEYQAWE